ncbi:MAG: cell wall-binding repeat-containing protein, partial [Acidimicrobiales bacterium]
MAAAFIATPAVSADAVGEPATVWRVAGADLYATAAALVADAFSAPVKEAYVATGEDFADALAATPAAGRAGAPLLLVRRDSVPPVVVSELQHLRPDRIVLLGGEQVVSAAVADELRSLAAVAVVRRSGGDRFETAAAVTAAAFPGRRPRVFVASGETFADALAAGATAARLDAPLLLTAAGALPEATRAEIRRLQPAELIVAGGSAAVGEVVVSELRQQAPNVTRVAGSDRYETSARMSRLVDAPSKVAMVVSGTSFADTLA